MEDGRDVLRDQTPFSYTLTKDGRALVSYFGKRVSVLSGKEVAKLERAVALGDEYGVQLTLAKLTGNFKRGNEKDQR